MSKLTMDHLAPRRGTVYNRAHPVDRMKPMGSENSTTVRVIAAVIRAEDRYLICRRPAHKRHGGLWEFPGGKIQAGENPYDAAARELAEELQVRVVGAGAHLYTAVDPGSPYVIEFVEIEIQGQPIALEHSQIRWCPVAEMAEMQLAPADAAFVRACLIAGKPGCAAPPGGPTC